MFFTCFSSLFVFFFLSCFCATTRDDFTQNYLRKERKKRSKIARQTENRFVATIFTHSTEREHERKRKRKTFYESKFNYTHTQTRAHERLMLVSGLTLRQFALCCNCNYHFQISCVDSIWYSVHSVLGCSPYSVASHIHAEFKKFFNFFSASDSDRVASVFQSKLWIWSEDFTLTRDFFSLPATNHQLTHRHHE